MHCVSYCSPHIILKMTNKQILKEAIRRYPNALPSAVISYTSKYNTLTGDVIRNLGMYPQNVWNQDTIQAIVYVLTQKTFRTSKI